MTTVRIVTFDRPNAPGSWGLLQQWDEHKGQWVAVDILHIQTLPDYEARDARQQFEDRVNVPVVQL